MRHALVREDNTPVLSKAIKLLGWIPEPLIARRWPHNTIHKRRRDFSVHLQKLNAAEWLSNYVLALGIHARMALNTTRMAPKLLNQVTTVGDRIPLFDENTCGLRAKYGMTELPSQAQWNLSEGWYGMKMWMIRNTRCTQTLAQP